MMTSINDYLEGKRLDKPNDERAGPPPFAKDPTYPPNQNRRHHQKNLDILMSARENSLRHPIFWTDWLMREAGYTFGQGDQRLQRRYREKLEERHSSKGPDRLRSEAEETLELLVSRLPPPHFDKLMGTLERYTRLDSMSSTSQSSANSWYTDEGSGGSDPLPEIPEPDATHSGWKKNRLAILGAALVHCSPSHAHSVAAHLGVYFHMDLFKGQDEDVGFDNLDPRRAAAAVQQQRKLVAARKKYQKAREDFVTRMSRLQHEFAMPENQSDGEEEADENEGFSQSIDGEGDAEDVSSDLLVPEFQKEQAPYSSDSRKVQTEELEETLVELRRMGLRKDEVKKGRGRPRQGVHLRYTAVRTDNVDESSIAVDTESSEQIEAAEEEPEERIVFINNLPIDTNEEEIDQIYSRCGPLDSIQLFNLRPDLDPGPLSAATMRDRKRKKRNKNKYLSLNEYRFQRPRTPVYGILRFQTDKGYRVATSDELCLFGCVIRRHPVLSIKHQEMSTLYLEKMPAELLSMDVEYKLAQLFRSQNVCVMQDGMRGVGRDGSSMVEDVAMDGSHQEYSQPSSCQVKFEDFHTAQQAYQWIKEGVDDEEKDEDEEGESMSMFGGESQLHWFRTPENSVDCWKRELILY